MYRQIKFSSQLKMKKKKQSWLQPTLFDFLFTFQNWRIRILVYLWKNNNKMNVPKRRIYTSAENPKIDKSNKTWQHGTASRQNVDKTTGNPGGKVFPIYMHIHIHTSRLIHTDPSTSTSASYTCIHIFAVTHTYSKIILSFSLSDVSQENPRYFKHMWHRARSYAFAKQDGHLGSGSLLAGRAFRKLNRHSFNELLLYATKFPSVNNCVYQLTDITKYHHSAIYLHHHSHYWVFKKT